MKLENKMAFYTKSFNNDFFMTVEDEENFKEITFVDFLRKRQSKRSLSFDYKITKTCS